MNCTWILFKWLISDYNNLKILRTINLNYYLQRINETIMHLFNTGDRTTNLNSKCAKLKMESIYNENIKIN